MVSLQERERRYTKLRKEMELSDYSVLILAGNSESLQRGYIRYLSDWRLWGGTGYMVFPLDGSPVLVLGKGSQYYWATQRDWVTDVRAGANKVDETVKILQEKKWGSGKIGVVGLNSVMSHGDATRLLHGLKDSRVEDATAMVDAIMAIKSPEEVAEMTRTYNLIANALDLVRIALEPGKTEREVVAGAIGYLGEHECYDGIAHIGHHAAPNIRPATDRIITRDDVIKISLEWAGPSGHWIELSGVYSFKEPDERMKRYYDTMYKSVNHIITLMKPGAVAGDVSRAAWQIFRDEGFNITDRLIHDFHGIGINVITPPIGLPESTDVFEENMVINIHPGPSIDQDKFSVYIQDNIVVTPQGGRVLGTYRHQWHLLE